MTIHSLLRHVGLDVPEVVYVGTKAVVEDVPRRRYTTKELVEFMNNSESATTRRLMNYFGVPGKWVKTEEMKIFWDSLTDAEKNIYRHLVRDDVL